MSNILQRKIFANENGFSAVALTENLRTHFENAARRAGLVWDRPTTILEDTRPNFVTIEQDPDDLMFPDVKPAQPTLRIGGAMVAAGQLGHDPTLFSGAHEAAHVVYSILSGRTALGWRAIPFTAPPEGHDDFATEANAREVAIDKIALELAGSDRNAFLRSMLALTEASLALVKSGGFHTRGNPSDTARELARIQSVCGTHPISVDAQRVFREVWDNLHVLYRSQTKLGTPLSHLIQAYREHFDATSVARFLPISFE